MGRRNPTRIGEDGAKNLSPADPADPYADYDAAKLLAFLEGDVLQRTPGSAYEYSNLGAGLLGYALTKSGGGYQIASRMNSWGNRFVRHR